MSCTLLYLLLRDADLEDWKKTFANLGIGWLLLYILTTAVSVVTRAWRYLFLLRSSGAGPLPGLGGMTLITLVRNLLVDLFPARLGSISYIVLLNRRHGTKLADCVSTFSIAFAFDIIALLPLGAIAVAASCSGRDASIIYIVAGAGFLASLAVCPYLGSILIRLAGLLPAGHDSPGIAGRGRAFLEQTGESLSSMKSPRVLSVTLLASFVVRTTKYLALYFLFRSVVSSWVEFSEIPFWSVVSTLLGGELGATLPIPALGGFGSYEAVWVFVLKMLGYAAEKAPLIAFSTHLISQVFDYASGIVAMLWLGAYRPPTKNGTAPDSAELKPKHGSRARP